MDRDADYQYRQPAPILEKKAEGNIPSAEHWTVLWYLTFRRGASIFGTRSGDPTYVPLDAVAERTLSVALDTGVFCGKFLQLLRQV
jgi:hypothetical protein